MKINIFLGENIYAFRALSDITAEGVHVPRVLLAIAATLALSRIPGFGQTEAPHPAEDPAYTQLDQAFQALHAKDYDMAVAAFESAIAAAPDRPSIHKDLAYTLLKIGENTRAGDHFAQAMKLDPSDTHVALEYAFLCYETGKAIDARRVFDHLRASDETAKEAFENIDRPLRDGIARWKEAVQANPNDYSGHEELARLAEQRDENELAAEHFEKAWRLRPDRRTLLLDLGRNWKAVGRIEDAHAALLAASRGAEPRVAEEARELLPDRYPYVYEFEKALELDPTNAELRRELAYLHVAMGNDADAQRQFAMLRPQGLKERAPAESASSQPGTASPAKNDAKQMGIKSLELGYMSDAVKYLLAAYESDPSDFEVMLKLGWTNNILKNDREASRWFDMARQSPNAEIATEASQAYHNLRPELELFRTTVWTNPVYSTRWHDLFGYAQAKTELRRSHLSWLHPYASVRFVGDTHDAERFAIGWARQYLSEDAVILAAGVSTLPWHGVTGWFEAGESFHLRPAPLDVSTAIPDYRGGISFTRGLAVRRWFADTTDDMVYVHRFDNDTLFYSQNRFGHDLPFDKIMAQLYWNWNTTFDVKHEYWANFFETGPGLRFRFPQLPKSMAFSINMLRGDYLIMAGNPHPQVFYDLRLGVWYAFTR